MGQEVARTMRYQRRRLARKVYLETGHILFRGEERLKVALKDIAGVMAADGVLKLEFAGGPAELELGNAAGKWRDRILIRPRAPIIGESIWGLTVPVAGELERGFLEELQTRHVAMAQARAKVDVLFYGVSRTAELASRIWS